MAWGPVLRRLERHETADPISDANLLTQFLCEHSAGAFESIVHRHGPFVLRICLRELPHQADAEDVFQATFLLLAQKAISIRHSSSLAPWLAGVARRLARRHARQLRLAREKLRRFQTTTLAVSRRESPSWWDDERRLLPQEYQTVIDLCLIQGLTRDEAARQLGQSPAAVHGLLYRARLKLKKQLLERGTVAGSALVCAEATVSAMDRLAPDIAQAAVQMLEQGTLAGSLVSPTVITLIQSKFFSTGLIAFIVAGGLLLGGVGWWGMHQTRGNPLALAAGSPTVADDSRATLVQPNASQVPAPQWFKPESWLQQQQQQKSQIISQNETTWNESTQVPPQQPPLPNGGGNQGGKGAPFVPPVIPVPPADRVPTGSERLNLAKGMLSSSGSLHEAMVPLLPRQSKHSFDAKTLLLSMISSEEELLDCSRKAPPVKTPPNVQVMEDPSWNGGMFQMDWQKEVILVAVVMERANSVTLSPVDKCWIAPDAKGVGHLLLNYSGKEDDKAEGTVPEYRKQYPYVMLKVPRKELKKVAVTVWRTGPQPDGVIELPAGK